MKRIALVPAFNEEKHIGEVILRLKKLHMEVIVVDDGSTDATPRIVRRLGVQLIRHMTNKGKGEAIKTGFEYILRKRRGAEYVVIIDADLQYSPLDAGRLLEPLEGGAADVVTGYRIPGDTPYANRIGNFVWRRFFNMLFGTSLNDSNCGYMAFTRDAMSKIKNIHGGYIIENSILADCVKNSLKVRQIPVKVVYGRRKVGKFAKMFFGVLLFIVWEGLKYRLGVR